MEKDLLRKKVIILLYVPVLHAGYLKFFGKHPIAEELYIPGYDLIKRFTFFEKEIRMIQPAVMRDLLRSLKLFSTVDILSGKIIESLQEQDIRIITVSESMSRRITQELFPDKEITVDTVFLQWDEKSVHAQSNVPHDRISTSTTDRSYMEEARIEGKKSSCWWRHNGAVLTNAAGAILLKCNNVHLPSEHSPYVFGDPRDFIGPGKDSHISNVIHAEQRAISMAADMGKKLHGGSIYTPIFPCPPCAKAIAFSGIRKLYFKTGHSSLFGVRTLKSKGIKIIKVI